MGFLKQTNYILLASLLLLLSSFTCNANNLVIVANTAEQKLRLTKVQVKNLFMGRAIKYELEPITLPPQNIARILFNTKIVGLTEPRIQSYWAQMRFSGRKTQPKQIETEHLIIEYLMLNRGSIAYLPADTVIPKGLSIVYSTK